DTPGFMVGPESEKTATVRHFGRLFVIGAHLRVPMITVVIRKGSPLEFRIWAPGDPLERGVLDILVPARGPAVEPDIVIAPVVGF
ncbi:MAG TPA: hypothetical protein PK177_23000, partial [Burkholderiaceae bacterium]|nr:hypothetical protein [Burkholderiaceae bacterium]